MTLPDTVRRLPRPPALNPGELPGDQSYLLSPEQRTAREYLNSRSLREKTQATEEKLKAELMEIIEAIGRTEGDGHKVLDLDDYWPLTTANKQGVISESKVKTLMRQKRSPQVFDGDAALELVKSKGIEDDCVTTVTYVEIDEDKVLAANYLGTITDEEMAALYTTNVTYAFVPVKE
jgi:hypothetical protein